MELVSDVGRVESRFIPFRHSASVNANIGAIGSEIVLVALDETPR
jgi:hypothetical protein